MHPKSTKEVNINILNQHTKIYSSSQVVLEILNVKQTVKQFDFSRAFWGQNPVIILTTKP